MLSEQINIIVSNTLMRTPLVTITIPTYNSAKGLPLCLQGLQSQSYKNVEVNIIDGFSQDNSLVIARKFNVKKIKKIRGSLLQARHEGVKIAKGQYILILDSDQVLFADTVARAIHMMQQKKYDMLSLGETEYYNNTFVEKLFGLDRRLINKLNDLSPFSGVIMPRLFRSDLLKKSYNNIPKNIFSNTGGPDHAIVYYEAWRISKKLGVLPDAIRHIEPSTVKQLMRKFYRWGYTSVDAHYGPYGSLMRQKERLRKGLFTKGLIIESVGSIVLLFFKGIAFKTGYYRGVIDRLLSLHNK